MPETTKPRKTPHRRKGEAWTGGANRGQNAGWKPYSVKPSTELRDMRAVLDRVNGNEVTMNPVRIAMLDLWNKDPSKFLKLKSEAEAKYQDHKVELRKIYLVAKKSANDYGDQSNKVLETCERILRDIAAKTKPPETAPATETP